MDGKAEIFAGVGLKEMGTSVYTEDPVEQVFCRAEAERWWPWLYEGSKESLFVIEQQCRRFDSAGRDDPTKQGKNHDVRERGTVTETKGETR